MTKMFANVGSETDIYLAGMDIIDCLIEEARECGNAPERVEEIAIEAEHLRKTYEEFREREHAKIFKQVERCALARQRGEEMPVDIVAFSKLSFKEATPAVLRFGEKVDEIRGELLRMLGPYDSFSALLSRRMVG